MVLISFQKIICSLLPET